MRRLAEALEAGRWDGVLARCLARAYAPFSSRGLVRPGRVPGVPVVCVGGATLGGSGKTPVAIAIARRLGPRAVLVGHAHRARPRRARIVAAADPVEEVGDEALVCAAAHEGPVVVGPSRQAAIDLALTLRPSALVLDGPLRLDDARGLSVLAVDASAPWGSGALPPAGDLRAPATELTALADHVVRVAPAFDVVWEVPPPARVGLFTALARPARLLRQLDVAVHVAAPDHGPAPPGLARRLAEADGWLATPKCAVHLRPHLQGRPLGLLVPRPVALPLGLQRALSSLHATP